MKTLGEQNVKTQQQHNLSKPLDLIGNGGKRLADKQLDEQVSISIENNNLKSRLLLERDEFRERNKSQRPQVDANKYEGLKSETATRENGSQPKGPKSKQQANPKAREQQLAESRAAAKSREANSQQQQPAQQSQPRQVGLVKRLTVDCFMYFLKGLVAAFDLISKPVYYHKHEVRKRREEIDFLRSRKVDPSEPSSPWRQVDVAQSQLEIERKINSFETYDELMRSSFRANAEFPCYGYRSVLHEQWNKRPENSDKLLKQVKLSEYKWYTYEQFDKQIEAARKGFLLEGIRAGQKVILYADTRAEWQIVSQALIRLGAIVGTMYSTLGVDGIIHTIGETQAEVVVSQRDKVNRLLGLRAKLPKLRKIIYFETSLCLPAELGGEQTSEAAAAAESADKLQFDKCESVTCTCFTRVLFNGLKLSSTQLTQLEEENKAASGGAKRGKDSLAVIMYTSGSTGIPKGVLISHRNIMATIKAFSYVTKDFVHKPRENCCTAYLPLAHIFEFCIESVMLYHGVRFGFATPHTLTDKSPGLLPGQQGDLSLLKPTVMIIVPLILDRVVQGVKLALKNESYFKEQLVSFLIEYKTNWQRKHYDTPLVDKIVCKKIALALGGNAKYVICGSAPLSGQTQTFVRAALNLKLPQGFGTTETCAATACQLFDDQSTGNVGLPVAGAQIKLEPWLEGNYRPEDRPNPRGEIVVGGEMIAQGYFNLEEQTREAFYVDSNGVRWYRTGDIGEFLPNGQLKIIDRKKDLVKLQNGEYISLGRVESTLKSNPFLDNFCVYANSAHNYVVALGPANELAVRQLAAEIVEKFERSGSPTAAVAGRKGAASADCYAEAAPMLRDDERQAAVDELKEVLSSYESDRLNNNTAAAGAPCGERSRAGSRAGESGAATNARLQRLCDNRLIHERVLAYVRELARERNLLSLEVPRKLLVLAEEWTEDKNLVTAAMKIRRNFIYKRYENELQRLYATDS